MAVAGTEKPENEKREEHEILEQPSSAPRKRQGVPFRPSISGTWRLFLFLMSAPAKIPYWQKLQDPRWQKVRLQVLERDGWKCRLCESSKETLHVHHDYYVSGRAPWDYPLSTYKTLCASCHEFVSKEEVRDHWEKVKGCVEESDALPFRRNVHFFWESLEFYAEQYGMSPVDMISIFTFAMANNLFPEFFIKEMRIRIAAEEAAFKELDSVQNVVAP